MGYFEVVSVKANKSEKKAPVIEAGDILREFQGSDMRVDCQKLKQMFNDESAAAVVLVFEKKKWGGSLLRLNFKVLTSELRVETVPEWDHDIEPAARMVSPMARDLLKYFKLPGQSSTAIDSGDTSCFDDMEWNTTMLQFANSLKDKPLVEVAHKIFQIARCC